MKWFIVGAALFLTSCGVDPERTVQSSNKTLQIEVIGSIDGCTIYRFYDFRTVHFVRCGDRTTTAWSVNCGKGCTRTESVETLKR